MIKKQCVFFFIWESLECLSHTHLAASSYLFLLLLRLLLLLLQLLWYRCTIDGQKSLCHTKTLSIPSTQHASFQQQSEDLPNYSDLNSKLFGASCPTYSLYQLRHTCFCCCFLHPLSFDSQLPRGPEARWTALQPARRPRSRPAAASGGVGSSGSTGSFGHPTLLFVGGSCHPDHPWDWSIYRHWGGSARVKVVYAIQHGVPRFGMKGERPQVLERTDGPVGQEVG